MLSRIGALWATVVLLAGLAAMGFAHRAPSVAEARLAAAELEGVSAADLCGDLSQPYHHDCPACHLSGPVPVPGAAGAVWHAPLRLLAVLRFAGENETVRPVRDPARGLRAPPLA
ncbi:hypothetical protein [Paenirhodobacter sp.]|uniref:hypothetical protein n=1 Tax=Paenirhodobacter sp. TaxID=1965326 RepID=UPI003B41ED5E